MNDIIKASLDGVRDFADINTSVGTPIHTPSGVTVIPISRFSVGFLTGGVDFGGKKIMANQNFGGGGGTGVSVTPIGFLTIDANANVNLIKLDDSPKTTVEKAISLVENIPEIISKIKNNLS